MTSGTYAAKFTSNLYRFRSLIVNELPNVYSPAMRQRKEKITDIIKEKSAKTGLTQKIKDVKGFYQLEMSPPSFDEMKKLQEDFALVKNFMKNGCFKFLTVKQAWLLILVGLEIGLWFFLGETIGKMHIVGYKV